MTPQSAAVAADYGAVTPYSQAGRAYVEADVATASPQRLVVMLYDGAIRFLHQAAVATRAGRRDVARKRLRAAHAIINHLDFSLDMSRGEIPARLRSIYQFCNRDLIESTANGDPDGYDRVAKLLAELRTSWERIEA